MTPDDLAAIRDRDAELDLDAIYMPESHTDRRALLAEVDRLREELQRVELEAESMIEVEGYCCEENERNRIERGLDWLPTAFLSTGEYVDREAVREVIWDPELGKE